MNAIEQLAAARAVAHDAWVEAGGCEQCSGLEPVGVCHGPNEALMGADPAMSNPSAAALHSRAHAWLAVLEGASPIPDDDQVQAMDLAMRLYLLRRFRNAVLDQFTVRQIQHVIDGAIRGAEQRTGDDWPNYEVSVAANGLSISLRRVPQDRDRRWR